MELEHNNRIRFNAAALSERIAGRRKVLIARDLGISRQLLDYYLKGGMPSVENLYLLARHFGLEAEALITEAPDRQQAA